MPEFNVDFSTAEDFVPVPADTYDITVVEAKLGTSQAGNAKLSVQLEITGGEFANRKLFDDLVLEGNELALGRTKQAFTALLGAADESFAGSTEAFIGSRATVRVYHDTWEIEEGGDGETRARVRRYYPFQGEDEFSEALEKAPPADIFE